MTKPLCIVAGVGPGNGLAFCKRFLKEGFRVAIVARSLERMTEYAQMDEKVFPFACDLSDPVAVANTFHQIIESLGTPEVTIYNAGSGVFGTALETSIEDFESTWRLSALGLLSVSQAVVPSMLERGKGTLLVTGATASLRGGAKFAAFSSAKAAQRNLAQSMARSLAPSGIHVALVIIDGIIDIPRTRAMFPDKPDDFFMQPDDIADTYYALSQQNKSAWTFEVDIRANTESW